MNDSLHQAPAPQAAATAWLGALEAALRRRDASAAADLLLPDGHWRDLLSFTWGVQTVSGTPAIEEALRRTVARTEPTAFRLHPRRTRPRKVVRAGVEVVEAMFAFETASGPAEGVVLLVPDAAGPGQVRAWTLLTALDELQGHEEADGTPPPGGEAYSREFGGDNWVDQRRAAQAYEDREPTVLVVGGGQAGLSASPPASASSASTPWSSTGTSASATPGASATTR